MLKTRVFTALVMAGLLIPAIFLLDDFRWAVVTALITAIAGWEFGRLAGLKSLQPVMLAILIAGLALSALNLLGFDDFAFLGRCLLIVSALFWLGVVPFWLRHRWQVTSGFLMSAVAIVVLLPTWYALIYLRSVSPGWLFAALLGVALADISAYFCGRAWGSRKLAPNISPKKTWEGAWGAMFVVTLLSGIAFGYRHGMHPSIALLVLAMPVLTLVSIAGDLFESLLKRQVGLKDSSALLPGHGGVMDRIDSHTAALPLIALLLMILA